MPSKKQEGKLDGGLDALFNHSDLKAHSTTSVGESEGEKKTRNDYRKKKKVIISVTLDEEANTMLVDYATNNNMSKSIIVNDLILKYLKKK